MSRASVERIDVEALQCKAIDALINEVRTLEDIRNITQHLKIYAMKEVNVTDDKPGVMDLVVGSQYEKERAYIDDEMSKQFLRVVKMLRSGEDGSFGSVRINDTIYSYVEGGLPPEKKENWVAVSATNMKYLKYIYITIDMYDGCYEADLPGWMDTWDYTLYTDGNVEPYFSYHIENDLYDDVARMMTTGDIIPQAFYDLCGYLEYRDGLTVMGEISAWVVSSGSTYTLDGMKDILGRYLPTPQVENFLDLLVGRRWRNQGIYETVSFYSNKSKWEVLSLCLWVSDNLPQSEKCNYCDGGYCHCYGHLIPQ
jgi:acyl-CoA-binding protein